MLNIGYAYDMTAQRDFWSGDGHWGTALQARFSKHSV